MDLPTLKLFDFAQWEVVWALTPAEMQSRKIDDDAMWSRRTIRNVMNTQAVFGVPEEVFLKRLDQERINNPARSTQAMLDTARAAEALMAAAPMPTPAGYSSKATARERTWELRPSVRPAGTGQDARMPCFRRVVTFNADAQQIVVTVLAIKVDALDEELRRTQRLKAEAVLKDAKATEEATQAALDEERRRTRRAEEKAEEAERTLEDDLTKMGMCSWDMVVKMREEDIETRTCKINSKNRRTQFVTNARNTQAVLGISKEVLEERNAATGPSTGALLVLAAAQRHRKLVAADPQLQLSTFESTMRAAILKGLQDQPDPACPHTMFQCELDFGEGEVSRLFMVHCSVVFEDGVLVQHTTAIPIDVLQQERDQTNKAQVAVKTAKAAEAAAFAAIAMVAHELRNTCQGVLMTATIMMSPRTAERELRVLAATCHIQLEHLRRALNGAIELSALVSEPDKVVELEPISVSNVVFDAVSGMSDYAASTGVSLTASSESQASSHFAHSHEASISSGLNNIIANAIRYTPKGGSITVGVEADSPGVGAGVRIIVTDTGCGIPEDQQQKLLQTVVGATAQGAGIGLYTANQSLKRHANGSLQLRKSVVDVGTVWCIALTLTDAPSGGAMSGQPPSKRAKTKAEEGPLDLVSMFPGGVVVVDDDAMARVAGKGALVARYGVKVQAFSSALTFLSSIFPPPVAGATAAAGPDQPRCLILMDHLMPDMDGEQCLDHIPAGHPHYIAMMSGTHFSADHREIIRMKGVAAIFEKPLDWQHFDAVLRGD